MGGLVVVSALDQTWEADDISSLTAALSWRDARGGADFWLAHGDGRFPKLNIRVSGEVADVHFFPEEDHPGFRCVGGEGLPRGGTTKLVYEGCDPASGEKTPNEFIISVATASAIAKDFFARRRMSADVAWFEL